MTVFQELTYFLKIIKYKFVSTGTETCNLKGTWIYNVFLLVKRTITQCTSMFLQELSTLESLKKMLTDKAQAAWEQINRLEEVRFQLKQDLLDKDETLEICKNNLGMDKNCANTSFKPDPLRLPKK